MKGPTMEGEPLKDQLLCLALAFVAGFTHGFDLVARLDDVVVGLFLTVDQDLAGVVAIAAGRDVQRRCVVVQELADRDVLIRKVHVLLVGAGGDAGLAAVAIKAHAQFPLLFTGRTAPVLRSK